MLYVNLNVMDVNRSGLRTSKGRDVCNVIVHLHKVWRAGASDNEQASGSCEKKM